MGISPERARVPGPRHGISLDRIGNPRLGMDLDELPVAPRHPVAGSWTPLQEIGAHLTDAVAGGGGEALDAALDELPERRVEENGVAALTLEQLFGDTFHPGLCEDAEILVDVEHEGDDWELSLSVPSFMAFGTELEPVWTEMTSSCVSNLLEAGGEVEGVCDEFDTRQFFPEGSECRTCLETNAGDFESCVDLGECPEEAATTVWVEEDGEEVWYDEAWAYMWACAPGHTIYTMALVDDIPADGSLPLPFDHERWAYLCIPYWDTEYDSAQFTCFAGDGGPTKGDALLEGMLGRLNYAKPRRGGEDEEIYKNVQYWVEQIDFQAGQTINRFWGFSTGAGVFSMQSDEPDSNGNGVYDIEDENYGYGLGGWGIQPYDLRPDGTDPTEVNDTWARDWLGAMSIKFSTTRDGIPISVANFNRCTEWETPTSDGSSRCLAMDPPTYGWMNDVQNTWVDSTFTVAYPTPITTLGSTGLPDPKIPGGVAMLIAGTPTLADPDWDDCTWPDTFVPDLAPMEDTPADFGGVASLWGQTYRFGRDDDLDLRVILNTNQARDFCPAEDL